MKQGRKEELEIARKARKRAIMLIVAIILFELMVSLMVGAGVGWYSTRQLIALIGSFGIMDIASFLLFKELYKIEEQNKEKEEWAKKAIPIERYVEVIPTEENEKIALMQRLRKIAKFYAVRNERNHVIEITIKFQGEEEMYHYEKVSKTNFEDNYQIVAK